MTSPLPNETSSDRWNRIVVPMAKGLERFFWNLAWFALFVTVLFGGTCITHSAHQGGSRDEQRQADPARSKDMSDLQHTPEVGK